MFITNDNSMNNNTLFSVDVGNRQPSLIIRS